VSTRVTSIVATKIMAAIPGFNVESRIGNIVRRTLEHVDKVIVVNDASYDSTADAARAAGAMVISHGTKRGYGAAIKSCFEAAKANGADILVTLDGDGQHDPGDLPAVLAPIIDAEADLVIGSRFLPGHSQPTKVRSIPRYRKFGIGVITFFYNFGSKAKISDAQSGFMGLSRKAIDTLSLMEDGMGIGVEILVKARKRGLVTREVPISCFYHAHSPGLSLKTLRHGLSVALAVVKLRLEASSA
jgi:glycosyltransferase involved in cell wall biosynthesis